MAVTTTSHTRWVLAAVVLAAAFLWLAYAVRAVTVPLLAAFLVAYVLDPVVDRFEARRVPRTVAIALLLTAALLLGAGFVLLAGPRLLEDLTLVPGKLAQASERLGPWLEQHLNIAMPTSTQSLTTWLREKLVGFDGDAATLLAPAGAMVTRFFGGTLSLLQALLGVFLVPVFAFYMLRDFDRIVAAANELVPPHLREGIGRRASEIDRVMGAFIRGQLIVALILATLLSLGLWAAGAPLPLLIGVVAGFANFVPYLGTTTGVLLASTLILLEGMGLQVLLMSYGVFVIVQLLEGWVITPKIVGESVGLSPFVVIVAVLVFAQLLGFFGVLIAVPLSAVLKILLGVAIERYRASPLFMPERAIPGS